MQSWPFLNGKIENRFSILISVGSELYASLSYESAEFRASNENDRVVDWGDGTSTTLPRYQDSVNHTYASAGLYIVTYSNLTTFRHAGSSAKAVIRILTPFPPGMTSLYEAFRGCDNLTSIPSTLLKRTISTVFSADSMFEGCSKIQNIPDGFFAFGVSLRSATSVFRECPLITQIPDDLFSGCENLTNINSAFFACVALSDIPQGLLSDCTSLQDVGYLFGGCSSLADVPSGILSELTGITNAQGLFYFTKISLIPSDLFADCGLLRDASDCFSGTKVTTIPDDLFGSCGLLQRVDSCFANTTIESIPSSLFNNCPNITSFIQCFDGCSRITTNVPELWEQYPNAWGYLCYRGCSNAANYSSIPSAWKDP